MLKRILYIGEGKKSNLTNNRIYKGYNSGDDLIVYGDNNVEVSMVDNYMDITNNIRFIPYLECLEDFDTLICGISYQVISLNNCYYAIDSNNDLKEVDLNLFKDIDSINIDFFKQ